MNDVYEEWLVKRKTPGYLYVCRPLSIVASVLIFFIAIVMIPYFGYLIGLAPFVGVYFLFRNSSIEYEYTYVTGELAIDKIISKSRRKHIVTLDMGKVAMIAPLSGHELDGQMKNSEIKKYTYTSGAKDTNLFGVLYSTGSATQVYVIEPGPDMVDAIKKTAPRKIKV